MDTFKRITNIFLRGILAALILFLSFPEPGFTAAMVSDSPSIAGIYAVQSTSPLNGVFSSGSWHNCGVKLDGTVICWGRNDYGQSTPPDGLFTKVDGGAYHTCGLKNDGTVACWGWNSSGQATPLAGTYVQITAGWHHTCALKSDSTIACWGKNDNGQAAPPAGAFTQISAGGNHTCGVKSDSTVVCWGYDGDGRSSPPVGNFIQVSAGGFHTCGLRNDYTLACWGLNNEGQSIPPTGAFTQVSANGYHNCALKSDGSLVCWGAGTTDTGTYPEKGQSIPPDGIFTLVSTGYYHSCGLKSNGIVDCWGDNSVNQSMPPTDVVFIPFLDLPVLYTNFSVATQGSTNGAPPGYVNSWFDHTTPGSVNANNLTTWLGLYTGNKDVTLENCTTLGESCYDGHDGIDFRHVSDTILAAAPGTVESAGWGSYGKQVFIDHNNCFATLYGHLSTISVNASDLIIDRQPIGVMGNTGLSIGGGGGVHLHFGVYQDPNCDGNWSDKIPVDPYPWRGDGADPWTGVPNSGLWKYAVSDPTQIDTTGGSASDPGDIYNALIPPGAISEILTFELLASPPVSAPSAQLRSTGSSFWMRVLEWLGVSGSSSLRALEAAQSFNSPVTITVNYDPIWMSHIDTTQLQIFQWDEDEQAWTGLATTLDVVNKQASAETLYPGYFDLQAPLVCPADTLEPNDNYDGSSIAQNDGALVSNLFDIASDEDWFRFDAFAGNQYTIETTNLATGVDTIIEIYDTGGVTLLASDDNSGSGNASSLTWLAPQSGVYFIRIVQASGSSYGCTASYNISVLDITPKSNDLIENAFNVEELAYQSDISTTEATSSDTDPDLTDHPCDIAGKGQATVWYRYDLDTHTAISIDTKEASYDTFIAIWEGSPGDLRFVACNNDTGGTEQSAVAIRVSGDKTYYIEIGQP